MQNLCSGIWWRTAWFVLRATAPATLPAYVGSTIRGALGHLLRSELCEEPGCGRECRRPETCRYFTLFERSRGADGKNLPKPFVLLAPSAPGLEEIAMGGPVNLPYRTGAPNGKETVAELGVESKWPIPENAPIEFGIRLLGCVSTLAPAVIEAVARHGLSLGGVLFRLTTALSAGGECLWDWRYPAIPAQMPPIERLDGEAEQARRIRIVFLSPTVFKTGSSVCFDPEEFANRFFEHSLARAVQVRQAFCSPAEHVPWQEPPAVRAQMSGHRLFHYKLPRHSFRQEKWLDFDGVVGYLDLTGEFDEGMPWARAAEILHFGQKAAFGQGKTRVFVLE